MTGVITSAKNPRVKSVLALADAKERKQRGAFAVEGAREIDRALRSGFRALEADVCPEALSDLARQALAVIEKSVAPVRVAPAVFAKLAVRENSDGLIAVFAVRAVALADLKLSARPLLLATEGVEKP